MSAKGKIPAEVLSSQLSTVIGGRTVRVAVFTTFTFDPSFFELNVLPLLFDQSFSQVEKVRRIQLDDALRNIAELAVYYDRSALSQDAAPAQLEYDRLDVRRSTGCFHPKLVLLLVDERTNGDEEPHQALILGVMSANLTRAGWWENVECAHFVEIKDQTADSSRVPFRTDLLSLLNRIEKTGHVGDNHAALKRIREFLLKQTTTDTFDRGRARGRYLARLFCGQKEATFSDWLRDVPIAGQGWNLEVISPYFDENGAGPLAELCDAVQPREVRIYLPRGADGVAEVTAETYEAVKEYAAWSNMPGELVERGRDTSAGKLPPRRVHAKVYRLWKKDENDLLIVGSTNLTTSAHSHGGAGNLEASFLIDISDERYPRQWWLQPVDTEPEQFTNRQPGEDDGCPTIPVDLSLRFDWAKKQLAYRVGPGDKGPLKVNEVGGPLLFEIESPRCDGEWHELPAPAAEACATALLSTSFVLVEHKNGSWRVLVREENMGHRPSLLRQLSPEEILEYWALLAPEQRAAFIEDRLASGETLEGIPVNRSDILKSKNTLFDRFAGIYHSFGCLRAYVIAANEERRFRDIDARLFGARYDSLPVLLERSLNATGSDPVLTYVTFLCARQLRDWFKKHHRDLLPTRKGQLDTLDGLLERVPDLRNPILAELGPDGDAFLSWYEKMFLKEFTQ